MSKNYNFQLADHSTGEVIQDSGGKLYVVAAGGTAKLALTDKDGATVTNPVSLTNGKADFWVADSVTSIDIYGFGPNGHAITFRGISPSGPNELRIDQSNKMQAAIIPFDVADQAGDNTETDTGLDEPTNAVFLPSPVVRTVTLDATETIDVGTDSTDSGDADGFIAGVSVATAVTLVGTLTNGSNTLGALFEVQDSANSGDLTHEAHISGGKSITWTLSAGADDAAGFIVLPYMLTV